MAARDLDALFPGLAGKPTIERDVVRLRDCPALRPETLRLGASEERFGLFLQAYQRSWRAPQRTLWTPCLAGAVVGIYQLAPSLISEDYFGAAINLLRRTGTPDWPRRFGDFEHVAVCVAADFGISLFRRLLPEDLALTLNGLPAGVSHSARFESIAACLASTSIPLPMIALTLPSALGVGLHQSDAFLCAQRPFASLAQDFATLAGRRSIGTWEAVLDASVAYWREARGQLALKMLWKTCHDRYERSRAGADKRVAAGKTARIAHRPALAKLEKRLEASREHAASMERQVAEWKRDLNAARREAAEARQARDRAVARLRVVEARLEEAQSTPRSPTEAGSRPGLPPAPDPPAVADSAPLRPAVPDVPAPETVLNGRSVYLFTGQPRAAARRAMAKVLERYGATCQVFDGNRLSELGPQRYDPGALVIIDTRQLCHSASDAIEERARSSGAWFYVGPAGPGSLAQRVAERWWRTHR